MILDEPTSALDFRNQLLVYELLRKLAGKGKMIIACTHDPNHVKWFCDEVLILKNGVVLYRGAVNETLTEHCLRGTVWRCMYPAGWDDRSASKIRLIMMYLSIWSI